MALEKLATDVGAALKERNWLLAAAESCTGGGLCYWLTSTSGSSQWFERGFVTYSNEAKTEMLAVPAETINTFGAVSKETAQAMAAGTLRFSNANVSIAITGIAGPEGGTDEKPVGTVWIAWALPDLPVHAEHYIFQGSRTDIRRQSIENALVNLLLMLKK